MLISCISQPIFHSKFTYITKNIIYRNSEFHGNRQNKFENIHRAGAAPAKFCKIPFVRANIAAVLLSHGYPIKICSSKQTIVNYYLRYVSRKDMVWDTLKIRQVP